MKDKSFLLQRITIFCQEEFDPCVDAQVEDILRRKFSIRLPQRQSFDDSLESSISDHDVINLIQQYRALSR